MFICALAEWTETAANYDNNRKGFVFSVILFIKKTQWNMRQNEINENFIKDLSDFYGSCPKKMLPCSDFWKPAAKRFTSLFVCLFLACVGNQWGCGEVGANLRKICMCTHKSVVTVSSWCRPCRVNKKGWGRERGCPPSTTERPMSS